MSSARARAIAALDQHYAEYITLLTELVRSPSTLGHVRPAQAILYRQARRIGLTSELRDLDVERLVRHPEFAPVAWSSAGQPNLRAVLPASDEGGRALVLNGHIDVVSAAPEDWWAYDPWGATIVGGRMYGRGALDMKAGLVAALLAMHAVHEARAPLAGPVIFESVVEEECTGNGMLAARCDSGPVDGAVITEPTNLEFWLATPGVVWFEVTVQGKPAYVGQASVAVNAIEVATALIGRLKPQAVADLNAAFHHPAFAGMAQPLTLSVGTIEGGDWPSNVPLECRFTCRMSFPIGWSFEEARRFVEQQVTRAAAADSWLVEHPPAVRFPGFRARAWETTAVTPLVKQLAMHHRQTLGVPPVFSAFPGTADARYFQPEADEQVVYYGPAGGNIHAPDEYVELESLRLVARVLTELIMDWCG